MNPNRLITLTVGLLLVVAIVWLSWPQALPGTNLTLASVPDDLDSNLSEDVPQREIPKVNTEALGKQGDLAFIWQDLLYIAEAANGSVSALSDSGRAIAPAWSHDGEWLAYIRVTDAESNRRGALWLVRRDGGQSHEVQGLPEAMGLEFQLVSYCKPTGSKRSWSRAMASTYYRQARAIGPSPLALPGSLVARWPIYRLQLLS